MNKWITIENDVYNKTQAMLVKSDSDYYTIVHRITGTEDINGNAERITSCMTSVPGDCFGLAK